MYKSLDSMRDRGLDRVQPPSWRQVSRLGSGAESLLSVYTLCRFPLQMMGSDPRPVVVARRLECSQVWLSGASEKEDGDFTICSFQTKNKKLTRLPTATKDFIPTLRTQQEELKEKCFCSRCYELKGCESQPDVLQLHNVTRTRDCELSCRAQEARCGTS
ncbi:unnamed protein product [Pleuronectes platessa]|uniref:Uncharacterized protein n=1 Tax=Pleuronectes platessa TaxID=8262 RepID=A0A9N7TRF3_PLEPL|nr:unnamed protein product [Pleuronectes platessa]